MALQKTRHATQLLLQIEYLPQCVQAMLLPSKWVASSGKDATTDKDLIWCTALLKGRQGVARAALTSALPPNSEVVYYHPREEENPTVHSQIDNITGDEKIDEGIWCLVLRAPEVTSFLRVIFAFFTSFMGLNGPMTDESFMHQLGQKFLTRRNKNPSNGST